MFPTPIKIALLLAVAFGQIFGGVSCCCFGQFLLSTQSDQAIFANAGVNASDVALATQVIRCPRCIARTSDQILQSAANSRIALNEPAEIVEDTQCRCERLVNDANPSNDRRLIRTAMQMAVSHDLVAKAEREISKVTFHHSDIPLPSSGHSWQSLACVWKI